MKNLRWLHLSDIHFQGDEHYETQKMRDRLIEKLKEIVKEKKIDIIFVTGDLAYQGSGYDKKMQTFIEEILKVASLDKKNLIIIPGNHDIKRNQTRQLVINGTRSENFVFEKSTLDSLKKDFTQYNIFHKKIKGDDGYFEYKIINYEDINIFMNGSEIIEGIIQSIFDQYGDSFSYSNTTLRIYFKILIYWSIYECDIFNEVF